ncbi:MAG TPA: SdpI family protein [Chthonomonadales bacterium]|nr:SdpI family protein [Chthonomonadales bacterium]
MANRNVLIMGLVLAAAAELIALSCFPSLPPRIPVHWNLRGEPDGWADKIWALVIGPAGVLSITALTWLLPRIAPKGFEPTAFRSTFNYVMFLVMLLLLYTHVIMLQAALRPHVNWGRYLVGGMFLFFALMGNVMGKVKRNFWMGVRTPWTLASEENWNRTHRFAGQLWLYAGLLGGAAILAGAPIQPVFVCVMIALLYPVLYSYILFARS